MNKPRYIITEISDKTFDPDYQLSDINDYRVRRAARGILIHGDKTALINISKKNHHKLPGGGIEVGESNEKAFKREMLEETGCHCEITEDEQPITIEYRDKHKLLQISYIFVAKVIGEIGTVNFEQGELDEGAQLEWVPINEVDTIMSTENPIDYEDRFIHLRDVAIFNHYKKRLLENAF